MAGRERSGTGFGQVRFRRGGFLQVRINSFGSLKPGQVTSSLLSPWLRAPCVRTKIASEYCHLARVGAIKIASGRRSNRSSKARLAPQELLKLPNARAADIAIPR
jgi:hypothetical protein